MTWQGIECTSAPSSCAASNSSNCHIRGILLNKYGLQGTLPDSLDNLYALTKLDVSESKLRGPIPETFGNMTTLRSLLLQTNLLTSTIPSALGSLLYLTNLKLIDNYLVGSIPSSFGLLTSLNVLQINDNYLSGSIPSEIMKLTNLQYLYLQDNLLTGTIPSALGSLQKVWYLYMQENYLNGTIPPSIGQMSLLILFSFDNNMMTGPLPSEIGLLSQLQYLYLQYNSLSKALPASIGSLKSLLFCAIDHNELTGSLPSTIGSLSKLQYLYLRYNSLSQILPSDIGKLTRLGVLSLHMNRFTGPIPESFGDMSSMQYLSLYSNFLTNTIPTSLGKLRYLYSLAMEANNLGGSIPMEFGAYTRLVYMTLNLNALTGIIPPHLGNITTLNYVNFRGNYLSGSLPPQFFQANLISVSLQDNSFTGMLPSQIGSLTKLTDLYLQENHFTGGFQSLFWQAENLSLIILDISNNRFQGTLPSELFLVPHLQIFALTSNCFHGTIPDSICSAEAGIVFYMDGLGLADVCINDLVKFPFSDVPIMNSIEGDIPSCIWNLTSMQVLSMSGNALTGTIRDLSPNSRLINLTLSHNHLSGTIPLTIQSWPFQFLDLSYNKFLGTCEHLSISPYYSSDYSNYSRVKLAVNRLSGVLPQLIGQYRNPDILEGNIFSCDYVPNRDETSESYICGSLEFDQSLYTLGALIAFILITLVVVWYSSRTNGSYIKEELVIGYKYVACESIDPVQLPRLYSFATALESVAKISLVIMILGFFCCLPIYILKSFDNGESSPEYATHSYLYRWMWTTAYATNEVNSGILLAAWAISIFVFVMLLSLWLDVSSVMMSQRSSTASDDHFKSFVLKLMAATQFTFVDAFQMFSLAIINIVVVGAVNVAYIVAVFKELSPTNHLMVQLAMATFKYYWNFVCVPWLILGPLKNTRYKAGLRLTLMLINSVWLPFLVTALTSPACFRSILISPEEIRSVYSYLTCDTILYDECIEFELFSVEVTPLTPAFSYDYLCASSVITVYLPVYLYTYCLLIIIPILSTYLLVSHTNYSRLPSGFRETLNGLMWPNAWRETDITRFDEEIFYQIESNNSSVQSASNELPSPESLLKVQTVIATLMHHVTILLTFGLCCPVLAFAVTASICVSVLQWRYLVGRFAASRLISRQSVRMVLASPRIVDGALITLELCVGNALDYFRATLWPVLWTSCMFFVFACWDMAGDEVGWDHSLWAPCGALSFAILIWLLMRFRKRYILASTNSRGSSQVSLIIEKIDNPIGEEIEQSYDDSNRLSNRTTSSFQIDTSPTGSSINGTKSFLHRILQ